MNLQDSFMKSLAELMKTYPVLKQPNQTKVQVSVTSIIEMGQKFHAKGYKDANDNLSMFDKIFGK